MGAIVNNDPRLYAAPACVFCGLGIKGAMKESCETGLRHCMFCRVSETRAADPCIPGRAHKWKTGHDIQRVNAPIPAHEVPDA